MKAFNLFFILANITFLLEQIKSAIIKFDYSESNWPSICHTGRNQSPINLEIKNSEKNNNYARIISNKYNITEPTSFIEKNGKYSANFFNQGYIELVKNNTFFKYWLNEIIIHSPSEHLINNTSYDLELQIVHLKDEDYTHNNELKDLNPSFSDKKHNQLIVSILFKVDLSKQDNNEFLNALNFSGNVKNINPFLNEITSRNFIKFWFYEGSETLPGCLESVNFIIIDNVQKISLNEYEKIREWIGQIYPEGNNREIQGLFNRKVWYIDSRELYIPIDLSSGYQNFNLIMIFSILIILLF